MSTSTQAGAVAVPYGWQLVPVEPVTGKNYEAGLWSRRNWECAIEDQPALVQTQAPACTHRIADARNPIVKSGYLCVDCGVVFSAADHCAPQAAPASVEVPATERMMQLVDAWFSQMKSGNVISQGMARQRIVMFVDAIASTPAQAQEAIAREQEACALACEALVANATDWDSSYWDQACNRCALEVRNRMQSRAAFSATPAAEMAAPVLVDDMKQELMALYNEIMKQGRGMHYWNYASAVLARYRGALAVTPAAPAHPAEGVQSAQYLPLLLRDIARDLEITVHEACAALKPLGNFSVNSAVTAEMASKLRELFPAVAAPAAGIPAKAAKQEQPIALLRIGKSGFGVDVERWAIGELGNGNHPLFTHAAAQPGDAALLDFLQDQCIDLRCFTTSDGEDVGWRTVQHHMDKPHERVVSEVCSDDPRRAIREAMARIERDPYCTGPLHLEDDAATGTGSAVE